MTDFDSDQSPLFPPPWPTASHPPEPASPTPAPRSRRTPTVLALVGVVALLAGAAGAAVGVSVSDRSSNGSSPSGVVVPDARDDTTLPAPFGDDSGSSSSGTNVNIDLEGIAEAVSPAVVNIATTQSGGGQAAGSGMVLTSSGEVLTNSHVISGATKIEVEVGVTGDTYTAKVIGYDADDDVALLKLNDASDMETITTASLSSVSRNDAIAAIGNALGRFGEPTVVAGTVTALNQQVTAGDGLEEETLSGMIRVAASIQPGDSGGALVNDEGAVIGMNTAAAAGSGRFGYQAGATGFAIPIENALEIVDEIKDGDPSNGAHIGDRALLGVVLADPSDDRFGSGDGGTTRGAAIADVGSDTPAADAGMEAGDTITAIGSRDIGSIDDLRDILDTHHPGDEIEVSWVDASGQRHRADITLIKGPPA